MRSDPRQASAGASLRRLLFMQFRPDGRGFGVRVLRPEGLHGAQDERRRPQAVAKMRRPGCVLAPGGGSAGHRCGRILAIGERVFREAVVIRTEVGGGRQNGAQAMGVGEPGLQSEAGALTANVALALVIQPEIGDTQALGTLDERMAELVEDHLRQTVVRVERLGAADGHEPLPVGRGVYLRRTLDPEADTPCNGQPDRVERVEIAVAGLTFHCGKFAAMKVGRCPICKKELAKRTKNFPFCSSRCKLVDAGNWFEGSYRIETEPTEPDWGES